MMLEKKTIGKEKIQVQKKEQLNTSEGIAIGKYLTQDPDSNKSSKENFPIVGIGASAGGLAAFEAFFSAISKDSNPGMAFVLVQHLDPKHKSILTDLIGRYTYIPVYAVKDGMVVRPNCIYVIPPNRDITFEDGTLQLKEPAKMHGFHLPINLFLSSLALGMQELAIGIILSGTGEDGTLGVSAIKAEGGMVMVQSPETSEYDGMPRSAIATGLADYILPPAKMPAQLIKYVNHEFGKRSHVISQTEEVMKKIFNHLRIQTGHDFSYYKQTTINRRIERRMAIRNVKSGDEYVHYLEQNPTEVEALFHDLLIRVTSFFRNPIAFEALQEKVIPNLFTNTHLDSTIRIWVPGCSTGEEAYSIGILLQELKEFLKKDHDVQIFATDIDSRAIRQARSGVYPPTISIDISPERLKRFFTQDSYGNYHIQKSVRDMIIFSEQDIIKDSPFSKLDMLSCRNLLIYLDKRLQKKLIPLFHYALNPGGFLFLGPSETLGEFENFFKTLENKSKIYRKKNVSNGVFLGKMFSPPQLENKRTQGQFNRTPEKSKLQLRELTEQTLLQDYAPASVLVNQRGDILYTHGRTGMYLEPASGEAGMNILKMAREGLKTELSTALYTAMVHKEPVSRSKLLVKTNGDFTTINFALRPVKEVPVEVAGSNLFLVTFEELNTPDKSKIWKDFIYASESACDKSKYVDARILELELQIKEENLKAYNEELETSNEELKSSYEEMQSINEELQSTNEELETSKEELQSVNEELTTVNTELQNRVIYQSQAINDMNNLLAGIGIGTIFVDSKMHIMRFTPQVTHLINLIPTDIGRPLEHIVSNLSGYDQLVKDAKEVLDTLTGKDIEVQTQKDAWYLLRIRPYRTIENVIEGVVITFTNITEIVQAREILMKSEAISRLAVIVHDASDAITLQDNGGGIQKQRWFTAGEKLRHWR